MPIHHTTIGPVWARMTAGDREEVAVVAFGWNDADPEQITGVWVLGPDKGLRFVRESRIRSLEPLAPAEKVARERAEMEAEGFREAAEVLLSERDAASRRAEIAETEAVRFREAAEVLLSERDAALQRAETAEESPKAAGSSRRSAPQKATAARATRSSSAEKKG